MLWVYIGGRRYAFSYNHVAKAIEMRDGLLEDLCFTPFRMIPPSDTPSGIRRAVGALWTHAHLLP